MAFDGLVCNAVVEELKSNLIGGKIQKIFEPSANEILLSIYANGLQYMLSINISSNFYSMHLTTLKRGNPLVAPNFCMLLRKHLMNFRITDFVTQGLERIVIIEFAGNDENRELITKKLVIELMGKHSNILLLDQKNTIIDAIRHFSIENGSYRNIFPRQPYIFPASDKIEVSEFASLENNLPESMDLVSFFSSTFTGISKNFVQHAIQILNLSNSLSKENYTKLAYYILDIKEKLSANHVECISYDKDYSLVACSEKKPLQVNFFLDDYYSHKQLQEQFLSYRNQLLHFVSGKLKKISKKLSTLESKLEECTHMEEYKLYGELLTAYMYKIPKEHLSHIVLANYYTNNEPIDVPLDVAITPTENAKLYFKKYHKLKNTSTVVNEQKNSLEKDIYYLESIVYEIQAASSLKELDSIYEEIQESTFSRTKKQAQKKQIQKKVSKPILEPITYKINDFKILVGKNNNQNDVLTFKVAHDNDIWFHVKGLQGSHTILITNGKIPSQEVINQCASIAAYHSKGFQSSNVPVDYTFIKYVKKPAKAKPGMVTYTNQKTVNVVPKSFKGSSCGYF